MGVDLIALIRDKQEQIEKLQAELAEARRLLDGDSPPPTPRRRGRRPSTPSLFGREMTSVDMAQVILRQVDHPLHVQELIRMMRTNFGVEVKYATLVSNLARLVKADKVFAKFAPNVYGLHTWKGRF